MWYMWDILPIVLCLVFVFIPIQLQRMHKQEEEQNLKILNTVEKLSQLHLQLALQLRRMKDLIMLLRNGGTYLLVFDRFINMPEDKILTKDLFNELMLDGFRDFNVEVFKKLDEMIEATEDPVKAEKLKVIKTEMEGTYNVLCTIGPDSSKEYLEGIYKELESFQKKVIGIIMEE